MKKFTRTIALLLLALAAGLAGCQRTYRQEEAARLRVPVPGDEALALRDWPRSTAYYASGATTAGPTGFRYQPGIGEANEEGFQRNRRLSTILDPVFFLGNSVLLVPMQMFDRPMSRRTYEGERLGPTYTAALPPAEVNAGLSTEGFEERRMQAELRRQEAIEARQQRAAREQAARERTATPQRGGRQRAAQIPTTTQPTTRATTRATTRPSGGAGRGGR